MISKATRPSPMKLRLKRSAISRDEAPLAGRPTGAPRACAVCATTVSSSDAGARGLHLVVTTVLRKGDSNTAGGCSAPPTAPDVYSPGSNSCGKPTLPHTVLVQALPLEQGIT